MLSLKAKNEPYIAAVMLLNGVLLYAYMNSITFNPEWILGLLDTWQDGAIVAGLLALGTNVATHLLPRSFKDFLVYWRCPAAPAHRAFSHYITEDPRINISQLHINVPETAQPDLTPAEQNAIWYKLLKQFDDRAEIIQSHGKWLLFRDTTALLWLFLLAFSLVWLFGNTTLPNMTYLYILCGELLLVSIAARNAGVAFVRNVISLSSL